MPNYNVRLQWTDDGLKGNKEARIVDAITAAGRHHVKGHDNDDLSREKHRNEEDDGRHIQWHVFGTADNVRRMLDEWISHENVIVVRVRPQIPGYP